jgi:hypothetical protein
MSSRHDEADQALERLGNVPPNLEQILVLALGQARVSVTEADALLAQLGHPARVVAPVSAAPAIQSAAPVTTARVPTAPIELSAKPAMSPVLPPLAASSVPRASLGPTPPARPRVDTRDLLVPTPIRKPLTQGLAGMDDLPELPVGRAGAVPRANEEAKLLPTPVALEPEEDASSFEFLVDEEILELDADDTVIEVDDEA